MQQTFENLSASDILLLLMIYGKRENILGFEVNDLNQKLMSYKKNPEYYQLLQSFIAIDGSLLNSLRSAIEVLVNRKQVAHYQGRASEEIYLLLNKEQQDQKLETTDPLVSSIVYRMMDNYRTMNDDAKHIKTKTDI